MRCVVLKACETQTTVREVFFEDQLHIGRNASETSQTGACLSLDSDLSVSRRHARVWRASGTWFVEDLGSARGTMVGDSEIKGRGAMALPAGTRVTTGQTEWMILPEHWVFAHWGGVVLFGPCIREINYALYHCGIPLMGPVTVRNISARRSASFRVRMEISGISDPSLLDIGPLEAGTAMTVDPPVFRLDGETLRHQKELGKAKLCFEKDEAGTKGRHTEDVFILGFWDWPHDKDARRTIAAFVTPRNPVVERIVRDSDVTFHSTGHSGSFGQLLRSGSEDAERLILQTLYTTIKEQRQIVWEPPSIRGIPGSMRTYQTIKPPHHVFPSGESGRSGKGTCLDLALLVAGCLENLGVHPLVFFTGGNAKDPLHAFAGCWLGASDRGRPILSDQRALRSDIASGTLLAVECTGLAQGACREGLLTFDQALSFGAEEVAHASWVCAVDIAHLRPPFGSITSIDRALSPEVDYAFCAAKQLARHKKRQGVEMTYLLYGLLEAGGYVTQCVAKELGLTMGAIHSEIETSVRSGDYAGDPADTSNCVGCKRLAQDLASAVGAHFIREQDLWWALVMKGKESEAFYGSCNQLGIALSDIRAVLHEHYPCLEAPALSSRFRSAGLG